MVILVDRDFAPPAGLTGLNLPEEPAVLAEPFEAPKPEIDVEAIIAEDPNQIVAPPEKPKRGWWRR